MVGSMSGCGPLTVTIMTPRPSEATVERWTVGALACAERSPTIALKIGGDDLVCLQPRIADALAIRDGDEVDFVFGAVGETFRFKVKSLPLKKKRVKFDVLIHDFVSLGLTENIKSLGSSGDVMVSLRTGQNVLLKPSPMWGGSVVSTSSTLASSVPGSPASPSSPSNISSIQYKRGSARLYFDGVSRNNPAGPCGYGFHIVRGSLSARGDDLVQGYGYAGMEKSSNEMEYYAVLEGMLWASRLELKNLLVFGVSELIIKQLKGEYSIKNPRLKNLYNEVRALLDDHQNMKCKFQRIHRDENDIAEGLANLAIAKKETIVSCNWPNVNNLMDRDS